MKTIVEPTETSARDHSIDAIHGMMLLHMITLHVWELSGMNGNKLSMLVFNLLFCFMPWFFFKAGMFYKPIGIGRELRKDAKRLLIPYCIFSLIGFFVYDAITEGEQFWYMIFTLHHRGWFQGMNLCGSCFHCFSVSSFLVLSTIINGCLSSRY